MDIDIESKTFKYLPFKEIEVENSNIQDINSINVQQRNLYTMCLPKNLSIQLFYGNYKNYGYSICAVKLTNTSRKNQSLCYLLSEFKKLPDYIRDEIDQIITIHIGDLQRILEYTLYLYENNECNYVDDLECILDGTTSEKESKKYYRLLYEFRYDNPDLFASKMKNDYEPKSGHIGAFLDDIHYTNLYGETILAIKCEEVAKTIFQISDKKKLNSIKLGLKELNCIIWSGEEGRKCITLGKNKLEKCLLFRINKKYL